MSLASVNIRLKSDLIPPFTAVQMHTMRLSNTQATCETLRTILRVVQVRFASRLALASSVAVSESELCDLNEFSLMLMEHDAASREAQDADGERNWRAVRRLSFAHFALFPIQRHS
jgi:hypothetical protein